MTKTAARRVIMFLNSGKVEGIERVVSEMVKCGVETAVYWIWKSEQVPGDWMRALMIPLAEVPSY